MKIKTVSKKIPIAMAIGWLVCVIFLYLSVIVYVFHDPMQYMAFIESMLSTPWQAGLLCTLIAAGRL